MLVRHGRVNVGTPIFVGGAETMDEDDKVTIAYILHLYVINFRVSSAFRPQFCTLGFLGWRSWTSSSGWANRPWRKAWINALIWCPWIG